MINLVLVLEMINYVREMIISRYDVYDVVGGWWLRVMLHVACFALIVSGRRRRTGLRTKTDGGGRAWTRLRTGRIFCLLARELATNRSGAGGSRFRDAFIH